MKKQNDVLRRREVLPLFGALLLAGCGGGGNGGGGTSAGGSEPPPGTVTPPAQASTHAYRMKSNTVVTYSFDSGTGALTEVGSTTTVSYAAHAFAARPDSKYMYVSNSGSFSAYRIDPVSGGLAYLADIAAANDFMLMDAQGRFLFTWNSRDDSITTYRIDPTSGLLSKGPDSAVAPFAQAVDPGGHFLYATAQDRLVTYRIETDGSLTRKSEVAIGSTEVHFSAVATDPKGGFVFAAVADEEYQGGHDAIMVFQVNPATGALTNVDTVATAGAPWSIAVDPAGRTIYVTNYGDNQVSAYVLNRATGALAGAGTVDGGGAPTNLVVDPSGKFVYVNTGSLMVADAALATYAIDPATGSLSLLRIEQTPGAVGVPTFVPPPK